MVAINLMKEKGKAIYLDTGTWSAKAIKEAKIFGETISIASSKDKNYSYIQKIIIFQKMLVIFIVHQITLFLNTNKRFSEFTCKFSL